MNQQFNSSSSNMTFPSTSFYNSPASDTSSYFTPMTLSSDKMLNSYTTQSYFPTQCSSRPNYNWSNDYYSQPKYFNQSLDYAQTTFSNDTSYTDLNYSNMSYSAYGMQSSPSFLNQYQVNN